MGSSYDLWLQPVAGLDAATPVDVLQDALYRVREMIPADTDDLTRLSVAVELKDRLVGKTRVTAAMIDATLVKPPRPAGPEVAQKDTSPERALFLEDLPWCEAVYCAELLDEIRGVIRRYIVLPATSADAIALWIVLAWCAEVVHIMPMLSIVAATMRSGKSTLAELVRNLCPRGLLVSSLTSAALFRAVDKYHPTLVADEADTWLRDERSDLRGIFNSGHSRNTAKVMRCDGDRHELRIFDVFGPKVIAMIGRPPSTIIDRSILIELRRKHRAETVERYRTDRVSVETATIRRRCSRFSSDNLKLLEVADPIVPEALHDRAADNWRGLFALADSAGGSWPSRAREAALALSEPASDEAESLGIQLLRDIRTVFCEKGAEVISSADLVASLVGMTDRPWAEFTNGLPLTSVKLARLVKPFGPRPVDVNRNGVVLKRYARQVFSDAWLRYLPAEQSRNLANNEPAKVDAVVG
ncbi:MAG TPA: DUF3631 domain-containing protein, partial [Terriglobia bacterium]|nr:DUF3631 domain-containing protein [Terriglobia bacterium]